MTKSLLTDHSENLLFNTFDNTIKPQIEELLSIGKAAGADLVEIFLEKSDNLSLLAEQEDISNVSPSFGIGAGIRVFLGKKDGFHIPLLPKRQAMSTSQTLPIPPAGETGRCPRSGQSS